MDKETRLTISFYNNDEMWSRLQNLLYKTRDSSNEVFANIELKHIKQAFKERLATIHLPTEKDDLIDNSDIDQAYDFVESVEMYVAWDSVVDCCKLKMSLIMLILEHGDSETLAHVLDRAQEIQESKNENL